MGPFATDREVVV